jgi:hypothetical protein
MDGLLLEGRTLYTDNFNSNVPLAEELLDKTTFIFGTVITNRIFLPFLKDQNKEEEISLVHRTAKELNM